MLKKFFCIAAALWAFQFCETPCFGENGFQEIETDIPPHILFLGDSIASGYGLEGYDNGRENCRSYANILSEEYEALLPEECGFSMTNLAVDGQNSSDLAERVVSGEYDDYLKSADCIVISIGGNDMLDVMFDIMRSSGIVGDSSSFDFTALIQGLADMSRSIDLNLESFDENIAETAAYIKSISPAEVIVQTLYNPFESFNVPAISELSAQKIDRLNEMIVAHSSDADGGYTVCDVASAFEGKANELTKISQFDVHPNVEGHEIIADCVDNSVRSHRYSYLKAAEASVPTGVDNSSDTAGLIIVMISAAAALIVGIILGRKLRKLSRNDADPTDAENDD